MDPYESRGIILIHHKGNKAARYHGVQIDLHHRGHFNFHQKENADVSAPINCGLIAF